MIEITVDGVSKIYKSKAALAPCSFKASEGSCVVLCGGNGAGKSTLLKVISGIHAPSSGTVTINEHVLNYDREKYLTHIGYMPDDFHAQEMMTVQEFLKFYGSFRKVKNDRIDEVLNLIGLFDKKRELVKNLSKGMRQRLIFGQSILVEPCVLILDEPTNGLDPYWVDQFISIFEEIKKRGSIIIFSTHMMDVAAEVGDTIIFMKDGQIIQTITSDNNKEETTLKLLKLHRQY